MIALLLQNLIYGQIDQLEERRRVIEMEINMYRLSCGLNALMRNNILDRVCQKYAEEGVRLGNRIAHINPDTGSTPESRAKDGGWPTPPAENLTLVHMIDGFCGAGEVENLAFALLQHSPKHDKNMRKPFLNVQGIGIAEGFLKDGYPIHVLIHMLSVTQDFDSLPKEAKKNSEKKSLHVTDTNYHFIIDDIEQKFQKTINRINMYRYPMFRRNSFLDELASQKLKRIVACVYEPYEFLDCLVEKKVKERFGQKIEVGQFYHTWRVYKSWGAFYKTNEDEYKKMARGEFGISVLINADKTYHVCVINVSASLE